MTRAAPIINALNAGELSPTLEGRTDLAKYSTGCKRIENFIPLVQGPALRRGGLRFTKEVKDSADRCWLLRFERSATEAFVIEIGDQYARFFTNHGYLQTGTVTAWSAVTVYTYGNLASRLGVNYYCIATHVNHQPPNATYWYPLTGDIYEIPAPWLLADLTNSDGSCALSVEQSGDVLYIGNATRRYPIQKLTRYSNTNWQFSDYLPSGGPFLDLNDTTITVYASAKTGTVTLTSSAALFAATDIDRLIRLEPQNTTIATWEDGHAYAIGAQVIFDGKTYRATTAATSGPTAPVHEHGTAMDGVAGVTWLYIHSGYGVARISAFTNSTTVDAVVLTDEVLGLSELPAEVVTVGNATARWKLGAWSETTDYPAYVAFWKNRLWFGGGQFLDGSVPDDFENLAPDFFGETTVDCAIRKTVQAQDVNSIVGLVGADQLLIFTGGGEFVGTEITDTAPISTENFQVIRQSKRRCRAIQPVLAGESVCYVQRAGRKLLSLNFTIAQNKYVSTDLAVLAERITRTGIIWMSYQSEPYSIIWCGLSNGKLLGFTYDANQDVTGWHRHPIGGDGVVDSGVTIPAPDGTREENWFIVKRMINGQTKRYIEFMEKPWEGDDEDGTPGDNQEDAFYVDSGLTYDGVPNDVMSGLDHLEGETVQVLADGGTHPDCVVIGGQITLNAEYSVVHAGLAYTGRLVTMRIEAGSQDGTSQGKTKRVHGATVRFMDTLGGSIGMYGGEYAEDLSLRAPSTPMGQPPPINSGDSQVISFPGDYESDCSIEILQTQPLPMTVVAIMPRLVTYDR